MDRGLGHPSSRPQAWRRPVARGTSEDRRLRDREFCRRRHFSRKPPHLPNPRLRRTGAMAWRADHKCSRCPCLGLHHPCAFDRQAALSWGCRCCPRGAFAQAGAGSADRRRPARRVYRDHVAKITDLAPIAKSLRRSDRSCSSAAQFGSKVNYAYASLRSQIHMETASEATTRAGGSCTTTGTTRRRSPTT